MNKDANNIKLDGNVVRWISNNNIPFADTLAGLVADGVITQQQVQASVQQKAVEDALAIARYISFREKNGYSKEELAEIKSEFGNDEVVDVLTGKAII
jgi:hypothetical protein